MVTMRGSIAASASGVFMDKRAANSSLALILGQIGSLEGPIWDCTHIVQSSQMKLMHFELCTSTYD